MKSFSAALFDLDGTLQDSEIHWVYATRDYLRDNNVPTSDEDAIRLVYGRSATEIYAQIASYPPFAGRSLSSLHDDIRLYYKKRLESCDIFFHSSIDLLHRLSASMPTAIVSGSPRQDVEYAAQSMGVSRSLSLILGAEDVSHGKPSPEGYLKAASLLNIPPEKCIVFEDAHVGVCAAKDAGMYCVAIARKGRPLQDLSRADEIVSDLSEFIYP